MRLKQERKKKNKKTLNIAAWNVRMLINRDDTDRRHIRTAVIVSELARYKIDIAALRLAGKGEMIKKRSGYSFFWSGRASDDKRKSEVDYAIKISLVGKLACPPKGVNDCFIMRLPLPHRKKFATIISVYTPTMINTD